MLWKYEQPGEGAGGEVLRIHYLQHVPFEGPAAIVPLAKMAGHSIRGSRPDLGEPLPDPADFDLLVILGGPMSVNDEDKYPWLVAEKELIVRMMEQGQALLGVCLGAQMIAAALGARIHRAAEKEIGWFPVQRVSEEGLGSLLPLSFTPLHWHGDTFDLPSGAVRLASTDCVPNQAVQFGPRALGLQFHLEATVESVQDLVANAAGEIEPGRPFQQAPETILAGASQAGERLHPILSRAIEKLLNN